MRRRQLDTLSWRRGAAEQEHQPDEARKEGSDDG
jgi:hypothetical protein